MCEESIGEAPCYTCTRAWPTLSRRVNLQNRENVAMVTCVSQGRYVLFCTSNTAVDNSAAQGQHVRETYLRRGGEGGGGGRGEGRGLTPEQSTDFCPLVMVPLGWWIVVQEEHGDTAIVRVGWVSGRSETNLGRPVICDDCNVGRRISLAPKHQSIFWQRSELTEQQGHPCFLFLWPRYKVNALTRILVLLVMPELGWSALPALMQRRQPLSSQRTIDYAILQ